MQSQDKTLTIYKRFIKDKYFSDGEISNEQIKKCKAIFKELYAQSNKYSQVLLEQLQQNVHALILKLECDLIDYTLNCTDE